MTATPADRYLRLTPRQRAEFIRCAGLTASGAPAAGVPATGAPAVAGQESLWLLWRLAPHSADYNVPHCYDLHGALRPRALSAALDAVLARHESLRTTFAEDDSGRLRLVVHARLVDVLRVADAGDRAEALAGASALAARPFDLRRGPLIRARLWRYGPDRHLLAIVCHHIVIDERSSRIMEAELAELYRAAVTGEPPLLVALPLRYSDAVAAQRSLATGTLDYWRAHLAGGEGTALPADFVAPPVRKRTGATLELELPGDAVRALTDGRPVTPFIAAAAVFATFLARCGGRTDVTFGTVVSGRDTPGAESLIGYFVNLVALRLRLDPAWSFDRLAGEMRGVVSGAIRNGGVPLQDVVRAVRPGTRAHQAGLFNVVFVHLSAAQAGGLFAGPLGWAGQVAVTPVHVAAPGSSFDLTAAVIEAPDRTVLALRYSSELYGAQTVRRWAGELAELFATLAARPTAPIAGLLSGTGRLSRDPGERQHR